MIDAWVFLTHPLTIFTLTIIGLIVGGLGIELLSERHFLLSLIQKGRSISSTEALAHARNGEGIIVEAQTSRLPGRWWYLPSEDAIEVARASAEVTSIIWRPCDGIEMPSDEYCDPLLEEALKASGFYIHLLDTKDVACFQSLGSQKTSLHDYFD